MRVRSREVFSIIRKFSGISSVERTVLYYRIIRRLSFPTMRSIVISLFSINLVGSFLTFFLIEKNILALIQGLYFGFIALSIPSLVADLLSYKFFLKKDPLFHLRRCFALSLFSCTIWIFFLLFGFVLNFFFPSFKTPENAFYLGLFIILPLRYIAIFSISQTNLLGKTFFAISQPLACLISTTYLVRALEMPTVFGLSLFLVSATFSIIVALSLINYIEINGLRRIGMSPMSAFKAFLAVFLDGKNEMVEKFLDTLGVKRNISIVALKFREKKSKKNKGIMVISNFHPGPFLNVGSSILPYKIQKYFENKANVLVSVPHGISGHEGNLVSQKQNREVIKVIERILRNNKFSSFCTPMVCCNEGYARANCQIFDNCALITLTQSPEDMEDLPLELGSEISREGKRYFKKIALIDAHNSIDSVRKYSDEEIQNFKKSALSAMRNATRSKLQKFKFGSAKRVIKDFTVEEGFGPGGLVVFLIEVNDKIIAYITIDGNNMIPGLREKILNALKEHGVEQGEIMTSDTHMVNGLVSAKLGYNPVGKVVNEKLLIDYIKDAVEEAKENLEDAEISIGSGEIIVKSFGTEMFNKLTGFMYQVSKLVLASLIFFVSASFALGLIILI